MRACNDRWRNTDFAYREQPRLSPRINAYVRNKRPRCSTSEPHAGIPSAGSWPHSHCSKRSDEAASPFDCSDTVHDKTNTRRDDVGRPKRVLSARRNVQMVGRVDANPGEIKAVSGSRGALARCLYYSSAIGVQPLI